MFDPNKPFKTRNGRAARIVCTDYNGQKGEFNFLTIITEPNGNESIMTHNSEGSCYGHTIKHRSDLINEGTTTTIKYLNLYRGGRNREVDSIWGYYYDTKEEAKESCFKNETVIFTAEPIEVEEYVD